MRHIPQSEDPFATLRSQQTDGYFKSSNSSETIQKVCKMPNVQTFGLWPEANPKLDYVRVRAGGQYATVFKFPGGRPATLTGPMLGAGVDHRLRPARRRGVAAFAADAQPGRYVTMITYDDIASPLEQEHWDEVVDVICTGSGTGGLAAAIAAADAGLDVFVADTGGDDGLTEPADSWPGADSLRGRLNVGALDEETTEYLDAITQDLGPPTRFSRDIEESVGVVDDLSPVESGRRSPAETFVGARLRDWGARCLASPHGVVYSQVSDRNMTTMRSSSGEAIEVAVIGSIEPDSHGTGPALADWLRAHARDRGIEVQAASSLQRLVFEDGKVVGAVVATPAGDRALRARRGVIMATGEDDGRTTSLGSALAGHATVQVCIVSRIASRFGRVELLTERAAAE
jgi:hypothetical protein